ncbi:MAG: hypothetical protein BGO43_02380 [Gammaproteobacteria bacterium 39-13]|nr:tetratricopeptide repeat protein [Gammaproteobacteria bacterium]OJV91136.1 MAG: hypothetical protein BGO43_02380 [Gammaproteobacteria bacterium 39-13]
MTEADPKLIESHVRLSHSKLWEIQRNYFASMGIQAWKEEVPFYISSNAFIGHRYALVIVNFIKEWRILNPLHAEEPFYLLEVGSGPGKFSFYFLKSLKSLLTEYGLEAQKFCYIFSDVTEKNIEFCRENPCFQPYIQRQEMDFAHFNVEEDKDIQLIIGQKKYSELQSKTPLIIISNYTFDCIKQDAFEYEKDKLHEIQLALRSRYKNFDTQKALHLKELRFDFHKSIIEPEHYYENPILNEILAAYPPLFKDENAMIMMPLGAMQFCDNMNALTKSNFFMISGDKGVSIPWHFTLMGENYRVTYDGCYSFLVNFHAIGEYLKKQGGDYLLTENANNFKVNLYSMGTPFSRLIETTACFKAFVADMGPEDYCYFFDEFLTSGYRFTLKSLLAFVKLSRWDPNAYAIVHERILELLPLAEKVHVEDVKQELDKVAENVYPANMGDDVYNMMGIFYQTQNENDKALALYLRSLEVFGDKAAPHNNAAMIYEKQKNIPKALFHYQKSYQLDDTNKFANRKIHYLTGRPYIGAIVPVVKGLFIVGLIGLALYFISR